MIIFLLHKMNYFIFNKGELFLCIHWVHENGIIIGDLLETHWIPTWLFGDPSKTNMPYRSTIENAWPCMYVSDQAYWQWRLIKISRLNFLEAARGARRKLWVPPGFWIISNSGRLWVQRKKFKIFSKGGNSYRFPSRGGASPQFSRGRTSHRFSRTSPQSRPYCILVSDWISDQTCRSPMGLHSPIGLR